MVGKVVNPYKVGAKLDVVVGARYKDYNGEFEDVTKYRMPGDRYIPELLEKNGYAVSTWGIINFINCDKIGGKGISIGDFEVYVTDEPITNMEEAINYVNTNKPDFKMHYDGRRLSNRIWTNINKKLLKVKSGVHTVIVAIKNMDCYTYNPSNGKWEKSGTITFKPPLVGMYNIEVKHINDPGSISKDVANRITRELTEKFYELVKGAFSDWEEVTRDEAMKDAMRIFEPGPILNLLRNHNIKLAIFRKKFNNRIIYKILYIPQHNNIVRTSYNMLLPCAPMYPTSFSYGSAPAYHAPNTYALCYSHRVVGWYDYTKIPELWNAPRLNGYIGILFEEKGFSVEILQKKEKSSERSEKKKSSGNKSNVKVSYGEEKPKKISPIVRPIPVYGPNIGPYEPNVGPTVIHYNPEAPNIKEEINKVAFGEVQPNIPLEKCPQHLGLVVPRYAKPGQVVNVVATVPSNEIVKTIKYPVYVKVWWIKYTGSYNDYIKLDHGMGNYLGSVTFSKCGLKWVGAFTMPNSPILIMARFYIGSPNAHPIDFVTKIDNKKPIPKPIKPTRAVLEVTPTKITARPGDTVTIKAKFYIPGDKHKNYMNISLVTPWGKHYPSPAKYVESDVGVSATFNVYIPQNAKSGRIEVIGWISHVMMANRYIPVSIIRSGPTPSPRPLPGPSPSPGPSPKPTPITKPTVPKSSRGSILGPILFIGALMAGLLFGKK